LRFFFLFAGPLVRAVVPSLLKLTPTSDFQMGWPSFGRDGTHHALVVFPAVESCLTEPRFDPRFSFDPQLWTSPRTTLPSDKSPAHPRRCVSSLVVAGFAAPDSPVAGGPSLCEIHPSQAVTGRLWFLLRFCSTSP